MAAAVEVRTDFDGRALRLLAQRSKGGWQARRLEIELWFQDGAFLFRARCVRTEL